MIAYPMQEMRQPVFRESLADIVEEREEILNMLQEEANGKSN